MKKNKQSKTKMAFGGTPKDPLEGYLAIKQKRIADIPNIIESPDTALIDNQIRTVRAMQKAQDNPLTQILDVVGGLGMQVGSSLMSQGITDGEGADGKGLAGFLNKNNDVFASILGLLGGASQMSFAYGGTTDTNSEVEGDEVASLPNGQMLDFKGPSHTQGGIDVNLPAGTDVFSDRIKIDGKSIASIQKKNKKLDILLDDLLEDNPTDLLTKNTKKRTTSNHQKETNLHKALQTAVNKSENPEKNKYAYGTPGFPIDPLLLLNFITNLKNNGGEPRTRDIEEVAITPSKKALTGTMAGLDLSGYDTSVDLPEINSVLPTTATQPINPIKEPREKKPFELSSLFNSSDLGDMLGLYGNYLAGNSGLQNTLEERATDTPNINAYRDFGKDGLDTLNDAKDYITGTRDEMLQDSVLNRNAALNRGRNSARSVNTQRALDIATTLGFNENEQNIANNFNAQMVNILGQEAQMENVQDQMVMQGEEKRDIYDRMDKANFFSQVAEDLQSKAMAYQQTSKDLGDRKKAKVEQNALNALLFDRGIIMDKNGNLTYTPEKQKEIQEVKKINKEVNTIKEQSAEILSAFKNIPGVIINEPDLSTLIAPEIDGTLAERLLSSVTGKNITVVKPKTKTKTRKR